MRAPSPWAAPWRRLVVGAVLVLAVLARPAAPQDSSESSDSNPVSVSSNSNDDGTQGSVYGKGLFYGLFYSLGLQEVGYDPAAAAAASIAPAPEGVSAPPPPPLPSPPPSPPPPHPPPNPPPPGYGAQPAPSFLASKGQAYPATPEELATEDGVVLEVQLDAPGTVYYLATAVGYGVVGAVHFSPRYILCVKT